LLHLQLGSGLYGLVFDGRISTAKSQSVSAYVGHDGSMDFDRFGGGGDYDSFNLLLSFFLSPKIVERKIESVAQRQSVKVARSN
jgi:hypothetical protein